MAQIGILDISVANLIAAGEVVERPAAALKELCENSIDAGAKTITVEIKNGGISLMRVTDDGGGMTGEDAVLCVKRHATSKIKTALDLSSVTTLGFRGEALAAITAVTHTRIMTKRRGESSGTLVEVDYGTDESVSEGGYPDGTTVICERLFATTPARRKFLKSDSAEGAVCASSMEKLALSHPEIAFRFISDGVMRFSTSGDGKLKNAIYSVYGREFAGKLCEIDSKSGGIAVSGYVGTPDNVRGNRTGEVFFINSRCVKNQSLTAALEAAFRSFAPIGKFPVCILNIEINAAYVDVNIHPSKLEVKFSDEKSVFDAVYFSVRGALEHRLANPTIEVQKEKISAEKLKILSAFVPVDEHIRHEQTRLSSPEYVAPTVTCKPAESITESFSPSKKVSSPVNFDIPDESKARPIMTDTDAKLTGFEPKPIPEYTIIGEAFCCYVIVGLCDRIILIDKHAAHERINFERMKANQSRKKPDVQLLLLDEKLPATPEETAVCRRYSGEISGVGFVFDISGANILLHGIPEDFELAEGRDLFAFLLSSLANSDGSLDAESRNYFENALYRSACKASVKAGRVYDTAHIRWICDNVFRYDCIKRCPHGRAVAFEISKKELDIRFGRIK